MSETTKIGVEVDESAYEQFRAYVVELTGKERGVLGEHLTKAMLDYVKMADEAGPTERIEQDIATVNRNVAETHKLMKEVVNSLDEVDADGGAYALSDEQTTHARRSESVRAESGESHATDEQIDAPEEPPHPNAARVSKTEWLVAQYRDADEIHVENDLAGEIEETYSFEPDTTEKLVNAATKRLPHVEHPRADELLVRPEQAEQIEARIAEETRAEATDDLDALNAAEPADAPDR